MAMTMTGEIPLEAKRDVVWAKLNDPEVLKACIPGCEELNVVGENEFEAVAVNKIGPVKAKFKGKVQLTDIDPEHEVAFVAVVPEGSVERIVGVSRYSASVDGESCECAVTVADEWQNKGLGTVLMEHLIGIARQRGIRRMYSVDLAENLQMRDLAAHLGFHVRTDPDDASQVIHELVL